MTNEKVIQGFRGPKASPDVRVKIANSYPPLLVFYFLLIARAKVLRERYRPGTSKPSRRAAAYLYQHIQCLKLVKTDFHECNIIPKSGCYFLKTELPVPRVITPSELKVTSTNGLVKYEYLEWDEYGSMMESMYKSDTEGPYFTLKSFTDGMPHLYLYATSSKHGLSQKMVSIRGLYEDFMEVKKYNKDGSKIKNICDPMAEEFLFDIDLLPNIYQIAHELLETFRGNLVADVRNNMLDDTINNQ